METLRLSRISEAKEPRTPSPAFLDRLRYWLAVFAEHYQQQISELSVFAYQHALKDLSEAELERGCDKALKECKFMPRAADIREQANAPANDRDFYISEHQEEQRGCTLCQKTGWKMVANPDGGQWATLCDCRKTSRTVP